MSSSEKRDIPASKRKLDKAREKGDVAQPGDIVMATSLGAAVLLLWMRPDLVLGGWSEVTVAALHVATEPDFATAAKRLTGLLVDQSLRIVLPIVGLTVGVKIVVNIIVHRGPVFSLDPVTLKFERLNPAQNLKQIFGARTAVDLGKNLAKLIIVGGVLAFVLLGSVGALVHTPACGLRCTVDALFALARWILLAVLPLLLALAVADVKIQHWLYLKRQKMTKTEQKRERIEQDGHPIFKQARQAAARQTMMQPGFGLRQATVVVAGGGVVLGFRYVIGETGLPVLVWRPDAPPAAAIAAARAAGLHVEMDAALAASLRATIKLGGTILDEHFSGMARAVRAAEALQG